MPCLYSLKTMYRRLPFIILLSILAVFALRASVVAPSILVQNYSVDDYKASCQNWDLAVSYHGILYVANNSGLVTFDGNTWNTYPLPDKTPIYKVSFQNDSIYTQSKSSLGYWLYDELGNLEYHPIDTLPSHIGFDNPKTTTRSRKKSRRSTLLLSLAPEVSISREHLRPVFISPTTKGRSFNISTSIISYKIISYAPSAYRIIT